MRRPCFCAAFPVEMKEMTEYRHRWKGLPTYRFMIASVRCHAWLHLVSSDPGVLLGHGSIWVDRNYGCHMLAHSSHQAIDEGKLVTAVRYGWLMAMPAMPAMCCPSVAEHGTAICKGRNQVRSTYTGCVYRAVLTIETDGPFSVYSVSTLFSVE